MQEKNFPWWWVSGVSGREGLRGGSRAGTGWLWGQPLFSEDLQALCRESPSSRGPCLCPSKGVYMG